jgi:hypothetical protein
MTATTELSITRIRNAAGVDDDRDSFHMVGHIGSACVVSGEDNNWHVTFKSFDGPSSYTFFADRDAAMLNAIAKASGLFIKHDGAAGAQKKSWE